MKGSAQGVNVGGLVLDADIAVTYATTHGVRADGTDETAKVLAAITACQAVGGTLVWPNGTIRVDGQLIIPNDNLATPKQRAMKWVGAATWFSGRTNASIPYGGTVLDLRYPGGIGCVVSLGEGALEITGISFTQQGAVPHTTPYLYITNTTLLAHHNAFTGHGSKTAATANQDAIVCGGTDTVIGGSLTAPFQGYGTVIDKNHFNRISRGVYGRVYFNANIIRDNTFWAQCGGECAIELDGTGAGGSPGNYSVGNVISGNLFEMVGYQYAVKFTYATGNSLVHNNCFDIPSGVVAGYRFNTEAVFNTLISGFWDYVSGKPLVSEVAANNTIIDAAQNQPSKFRQPFQVNNTLDVSGIASFTNANGANLIIQPSAIPTAGENQVLAIAKRSAADTNPGSTVLQLLQKGKLSLGGVEAGNIDFQDAAGAITAQFAANAKQWKLAGIGGPMLIDSGSGGSNVDIKAYRFRVINYSDSSILHQFGVTGIGFFGGAQATKQTVTGSRGGNAALASLLTALAAYGIITDSTTA